MRRVLPLVALAAAGTAAAPALAGPAEVYARVSPSVWKVTTYDADGVPMAIGSAVVVAPETLVTNCHVLAKARRIAVKHEKQSFDAKLAAWDPPRDLCQVKATGLTAPAVALSAVAELKVGQNVYAVGNPKGLELTVSAGLLSAMRRNDRDQVYLLQTSAAISGGSSGGGLFDENGALVGITTIGSVTGDAQNLNFAVPVDWVRELPERHARQQKPARPAAASDGAMAGNAAPLAPAALPQQSGR